MKRLYKFLIWVYNDTERFCSHYVGECCMSHQLNPKLPKDSFFSILRFSFHSWLEFKLRHYRRNWTIKANPPLYISVKEMHKLEQEDRTGESWD